MTKQKITKRHFKVKSKPAIIIGSILAVIIIAAGLYLIPDYYNHAVLNSAVQNEGKILAAADKNLVNPHQASSCDFVSGVGLGGGGWGCTAAWEASTTIHDIDGMQAMTTTFRASPDFQVITSNSDPMDKLVEDLSQQRTSYNAPVGFGTISVNQKTGVTCSLNFTDIPINSEAVQHTNIDILLSCEMDAHLPWYPITSNN